MGDHISGGDASSLNMVASGGDGTDISISTPSPISTSNLEDLDWSWDFIFL